ncbi:MAG: hypothetical protein MUO19_02930 [Dehalococcoidales bacterium]|nr:hypothetical protein [Dehalococcoidales bacterium]
MKRAKITEELAYGTALDRLTGNDRPEEPAPVPDARPAVPAAEQPRSTMIKLSVFLNREEDAYLENLASTAKFSGGKKLSKTKLVEAMVRAFRKTNVDVRGVRDDDELLRRMSAQMR